MCPWALIPARRARAPLSLLTTLLHTRSVALLRGCGALGREGARFFSLWRSRRKSARFEKMLRRSLEGERPFRFRKKGGALPQKSQEEERHNFTSVGDRTRRSFGQRTGLRRQERAASPGGLHRTIGPFDPTPTTTTTTTTTTTPPPTHSPRHTLHPPTTPRPLMRDGGESECSVSKYSRGRRSGGRTCERGRRPFLTITTTGKG